VPDDSPPEQPARDPELYAHPSSRPGAKVPHAWLTTRTRRPVSTLDLCGAGRFTVLTGIGGEGWVQAAAAVGRRLGLDVRSAVVGPGQPYEDLYGEWAGLRGTDDGGVLLVRPDGYVAFRRRGAASAGDAEQALESALRTVLDR
jgi:2,4-dichlorophenol 6-monooxygenase